MRVLIVASLLLVSVTTASADSTEPAAGWTAITVSATSTLDPGHVASSAFNVTSAGGWCAKKGDGIGEALTIVFAQPVALKQVTIWAGAMVKGKPSSKWNRPSKLTVTVDQDPAMAVKVDARGKAVVKLGKSVSQLQIAFAKVKKGSKTKASCLAKLALLGDDGLDRVVAVSDAKAGATLASDVKLLATALATCDAGKLSRTIAFPFMDTLQTIGVEPAEDSLLIPYATAADLVKAQCDLPAFYGAVDRSGGTVEGSCERFTVDSLVCSSYSGPDEVWWQLDWKSGSWKLTSVTRVVNGGE